jgi:4-hydroxybenzoate polyprenyltransferase
MRLSTALRLGRVSNLPTTWSNVIAGLVLSGAGAPSLGLCLGLGVAISLLYVGGMYLNDAFDREYDARERPERPIPAAEVRASTVFAAGFAMLGLGVAVVGARAFGSAGGQGAPPVLAALALAAVIVFYDAYHKQNPLSPVVMAFNRALVYLTAALSARVGLNGALAFGCVAMLSYLIGLTYAAKQENLREPRGFWPLIVMAVPFANGAAFVRPASVVLYALFALWLGYSLSFLLVPRKRNIKRAVGYMIAGISCLDAVLVAAQGENTAAALCVASFVATLFFQRFVPGT